MERLKDGYYVRIIKEGGTPAIPQETSQGRGGEYWQITGSEAFNYATGDSTTAEFSAVSNGSESGWKNISNLEPFDIPRRLFHVVMGVKDGCKYYFRIPSGSSRFGVDQDKSVGFLDNTTSYYLAKNPMYDVWLCKNYFISINADNDTGISLTPKVWFEGYKYDIAPVTDENLIARIKSGDKPYTTVTIGGVRT